MTSLPSSKRRVPISSDPADLVTWGSLDSLPFPLLARPAMHGIDIGDWLARAFAVVDERLRLHGAILFRGFGCDSVPRFERVMASLPGKNFAYTYRSTPRTQVTSAVFSSTEYPADQFIPLHNEMSYTLSWPSRLWFCCARPASQGGQTVLADSRGVHRRIPSEIRARFRDRQVMYVRNFGDGLDLSWAEVFGTTDRGQVEQFCHEAQICFEWKKNDRLRTWQTCQSEIAHPVTGEPVWFNQAHLFHESNLPEVVRAALRGLFDERELPRNAYYGDGAPIEDFALTAIRNAYANEAIQFDWRQGDVLLLDNCMVAHGRSAYSGERKILVGMTA